MAKPKKQQELEAKIVDLTADMQRIRADFENYRKRVEVEKQQARESGRNGAVMKLLPVIDNIERAIAYVPKELEKNAWAQGVVGLVKNLEKSLEGLNVKRIDAKPGTVFNPDLHEAIQMEDGEGDKEVIAEELQAGYMLDGQVVRHSMVKVKRL